MYRAHGNSMSTLVLLDRKLKFGDVQGILRKGSPRWPPSSTACVYRSPRWPSRRSSSGRSLESGTLWPAGPGALWSGVERDRS